MAKKLTTSRKEMALREVANRGGTIAEREVAAQKLKEVASTPAVYQEEVDDVWTVRGEMVRDRRGAKQYLRGASLKYFLDFLVKNKKEGVWFTYREIYTAPEFDMGDFYLILSWLVPMGFADKNGTKYRIPSCSRIKTEWNNLMERAKI